MFLLAAYSFVVWFLLTFISMGIIIPNEESKTYLEQPFHLSAFIVIFGSSLLIPIVSLSLSNLVLYLKRNSLNGYYEIFNEKFAKRLGLLSTLKYIKYGKYINNFPLFQENINVLFELFGRAPSVVKQQFTFNPEVLAVYLYSLVHLPKHKQKHFYEELMNMDELASLLLSKVIYGNGDYFFIKIYDKEKNVINKKLKKSFCNQVCQLNEYLLNAKEIPNKYKSLLVKEIVEEKTENNKPQISEEEIIEKALKYCD